MKDYVQMVVHELRNPTYKLDFVLEQIIEELNIDPKAPGVENGSSPFLKNIPSASEHTSEEEEKKQNGRD